MLASDSGSFNLRSSRVGILLVDCTPELFGEKLFISYTLWSHVVKWISKKIHFGKSGYQRISFFGLTRRDRADFEKSKIWFSKIENPDLDKIFLILFVGGNCKLRMNASWLVWMLPNRVLPAQSRSNYSRLQQNWNEGPPPGLKHCMLTFPC